MSEAHILSALLLVLATCFIVMVVLGIKAKKARADDRRKYTRLAVFSGAGFYLALCAIQFVGWLHGSINLASIIMVLCCFGLLLVIVWGLRWMRSEQYFRQLYGQDPGYCGRCGYSLTGNVSGICPECGWKLPDERKR